MLPAIFPPSYNIYWPSRHLCVASWLKALAELLLAPAQDESPRRMEHGHETLSLYISTFRVAGAQPPAPY